MTQQQVNQIITEAMGLCWHEWDGRRKVNGYSEHFCSKCDQPWDWNCEIGHLDFSTWQDWGRALEWAQGEEWWERFISIEWDKGLMPDGDFLSTLLSPVRGSLALAEFITNNPGLFGKEEG